MRGRFCAVVVLVLVLGILSGCSHCCNRPVYRSARPGTCRSCAPSTAGPMPPRLTPAPQDTPGRVFPPSTTEPAPPSRMIPPTASEPESFTPFSPFRSDPPRSDPSERAPSGPGIRLLPPEPATAPSYYPPLRENPPESKASPGVSEDPGSSPALPVDIPRFDQIKPRIANGLQPYPDGVTWLRDHGYRTVLHLRDPEEDASAARRLFEKKGLTYLSLEVSPEKLTPKLVDEFRRIITNDKNLPLFVYDRDSSLAGGLWFLHLRLHEKVSNDKAVTTVERLGFRADQEEHRAMWLAVQAYLSKYRPGK